MKQKVLKLMCLLCVGMMSMSAWGATETLAIDFEKAVGTYTQWDISNFAQSGTDITAHGGSNFGTTGGKTTGYAKTAEKIEKPQSFSCYLSKTSNNTTASTWYLEVSTDGDTWTEVATHSATNMAKGNWVEFSSDLTSYENVYVRLRYNGTTAVRAVDDVIITYTSSGAPSPSITVSETTFDLGTVNINEAVNRTFTVSQENLTAAIAVSSTIGTVTPTSIAKDADDTEVTFSYTPTVAGAFSGTITIADATDDITNTISVTGTAIDPSLNKNFKVFSGDIIEGDYIIYYEGKAMKNTISSNRLQYEEVTPDGDVITTQDASIIWHIAKSGDYWTIYSEDIDKYAAGNGTKNQGAVIDDGTDDKALWTVTGSSTYEFVNKNNVATSVNANLRNNGTYGFACYATGTGGALTLYRCNDYKLTVSASGYATYYDSNIAYTMPAGLTGFVATNPSAGKITLKPAYSAGDVVPAGVALVLKGSAGDYTLAGTTGGTAPTENLLKGTDAAATTTGGDKYYKLSYDSDGNNLGFYWATADGAAFTNGAHKAYLALTDAQASSVKGFRLDFDEATGITELTESTEKTEGTEGIYNLNGQRLNGVQKGINIVGGKKVLVK